MGKIIRIKGSGRIDYADIVNRKMKYDPSHKVAATLGASQSSQHVILDRSSLYIIEAGDRDCIHNILTTAISMAYWNHPSACVSTVRAVLTCCTAIPPEDALKYMFKYIGADGHHGNWSNGLGLPIDNQDDLSSLNRFRVLPYNFNDDIGRRRVSPREIGRVYDRTQEIPLYIKGMLYAYEPVAILIDDIGTMDPDGLVALAADCGVPIVAMEYRLPTDI